MGLLNWQLITLRHVNNFVFSENREIPLHEMKELRDALDKTISIMELGHSHEMLKYLMSTALFNSIMTTATWLINDSARELSYESGKPFVPSGGCVYFLASPDGTRVKIGQTSNFYKRTRDFAWGVGYRDFYALAIIKTPQYKQLERLIHQILCDHKIRNEEFHFAPVKEWIEETIRAYQS